MKLTLIRDTFTGKSTTGILTVNDGEWSCFTLEDVVRPTKIPGETAIPAGTYEVVVTFSQRFHKPLPLLLNVPNFEGIRIHPGNTAADTEGCIIVGTQRSIDSVIYSRLAFEHLFERIKTASMTEKIHLEIR